MTHDGSKTGHPGYIYWKNDNKNLYLAITTGTSESNNDHFIKLSKPISQNSKISYANKKPFLGNRRDFGSKELNGFKFDIGDYEILIRISKNNPRTGKRIKNSDIKLTKDTKFK